MAFLVEHRDGRLLYYFSDMKHDELLVSKLFDSAKDTGIWSQAAFFDEGREGAVSKESVEICTVAFFNNTCKMQSKM